jgi:hypothetical protein
MTHISEKFHIHFGKVMFGDSNKISKGEKQHKCKFLECLSEYIRLDKNNYSYSCQCTVSDV